MDPKEIISIAKTIKPFINTIPYPYIPLCYLPNLIALKSLSLQYKHLSKYEKIILLYTLLDDYLTGDMWLDYLKLSRIFYDFFHEKLTYDEFEKLAPYIALKLLSC